MKKLAIISSYHELCGIATYTEALEKEFKKHFHVDVLSLDLDLLNSSNSMIRKRGDQHIKELAKKVKEYDYVNIQFESGLYGAYPGEIYKRIKWIVEASSNLVITFHSVYTPVSIIDKNLLKKIVSDGVKKTMEYFFKQLVYPRLYTKIMSLVKKEANNKNIHIMVHNKKDKMKIELLYGFSNVEAFPLTYLTKENRLITPDNNRLFREKYGFSAKDKIIGLFGFISRYKGYDTAFKALLELPDNYKVLVCGGQHPMSVKPFEPIEPFMKELVTYIDKNKKLENRIAWAGSLTHNDFIDSMRNCDFVVLPYMEVNQSGSGIACLAIESGANLIMSNSKTFNELKKFYKGCFDSFDIGNYRELAYKILNYKYQHRKNIEEALEKYNIENNILTYKKCFAEIEHD